MTLPFFLLWVPHEGSNIMNFVERNTAYFQRVRDGSDL
jgi:hypothetical protein